MKHDERFKAYFDKAVQRYDPDPGSLDAVHARVRRRRNRRALVSAALVVIVGVGSVALFRSNSTFVAQPATIPSPTTSAPLATETTTTTTEVPTSATKPAQPVAVGPTFTWQRITDLPATDANTSNIIDPIATNDGFVAIERVLETPEGASHPVMISRVWASSDGVTWAVSSNDLFGSSALINELAATPFGLYAGGTTAVSHPALWRSDDGSDWNEIDLPLPPPPTIDESYQTVGYGINQIVAGRNGMMIFGGSSTHTAWDKLIDPFLPDGRTLADGDLSVEYKGDAVRVYSEPGHTLLVTIQVADFGIEKSKLEAMTLDPVIWYSPDGRSFSLVDIPGTESAGSMDFLMGAATDDGFVTLFQSSPERVWTSTDGLSWEEFATTGLPENGFFNGAASMGGRIVIIGGGRSGQFAYYSDDGVAWKKADAHFGVSSQVETVSAGSAGWFITGKASSTVPKGASLDSWAPPPAMWSSADGTTWKRVGLPDEVFGLAGIPFFGAPAIASDSILLVGEEGTDFSEGPTTGSTRVFYLGTIKH